MLLQSKRRNAIIQEKTEVTFMIAIINAELVMKDHFIPEAVLFVEDGVITGYGEMRSTLHFQTKATDEHNCITGWFHLPQGEKFADDFHVYAVEWNATSITWYVDGQKMWTYNKSTDQNALNNGQWPFDAPFYLILNQSVGNGSWARPADESFSYETQFDWVRVYQRREHTAIDDVIADEADSSASSASQCYYELSGRKLTSAPSNGVYIHNGDIVLK